MHSYEINTYQVMIFRQYTFYKKHKMIKIAIKSEKNHKNMANA